MPNRHRILIVDDDPGLRDALTEQFSLNEEFDALAVASGSITKAHMIEPPRLAIIPKAPFVRRGR
jgi:hypothetical protein